MGVRSSGENGTIDDMTVDGRGTYSATSSSDGGLVESPAGFPSSATISSCLAVPLTSKRRSHGNWFAPKLPIVFGHGRIVRLVDKPRFERAKGAGGVIVEDREGSPGEYLAKLWMLFGPPDEVGDGSALYGVRDRETGQAFSVSTNVAGISYGAPPDHDALQAVFEAFDAVLEVTPLADCTVEMQVGERTLVLGAKNGVPFQRDVQRRSTREQALARAEQALASEGDVGFFYDETVSLLDIAPDARELLEKLWRRALAEAVATLEGELSRPNPGGMIYPILESLLPRLEEAADDIGIDAVTALAPHAATIDAARRAIKD
jgi:hypothetical protein